MGTERDFDQKPYSADEARIAAFLSEHGVGGGDDPVGFILASHAEMARQRNLFRERLRESSLSTGVNDEDLDPAPGPA